MANATLPKRTNVLPVRFVEEVIAELRKVSWPSRQETIKLTLVVLTVSAFIGIFIGGLDFLLVDLSKMLFK